MQSEYLFVVHISKRKCTIRLRMIGTLLDKQGLPDMIYEDSVQTQFIQSLEKSLVSIYGGVFLFYLFICVS
jgi:hypothetical protein